MSRYNISDIDAVKSQAKDAGAELKFEYFAEGVECGKKSATEFSFVVTNDIEFSVVDIEAVQVEATESVEETVARNATGRKLPTERKGQVTKASIMRERIKEALAAGTYDRDELVNYAVTELGFKRPLARVYVKNLTPGQTAAAA